MIHIVFLVVLLAKLCPKKKKKIDLSIEFEHDPFNFALARNSTPHPFPLTKFLDLEGPKLGTI